MEISGLVALLAADRHADLARVYRLALRIGAEGHAFVKAEFHAHVKAKGKARSGRLGVGVHALGWCSRRASAAAPEVTRCVQALVADGEATKEPVAFVQALLDMRDKYVRTVEVAFQSDRQFSQELNLAFEARRCRGSAGRVGRLAAARVAAHPSAATSSQRQL